jgi:hypothetical protein
MKHPIVNMKTAALAVALAVAGCAATEVATPPPPQVVAVEKQDSPDRLERSNTVTVTAIVSEIDVARRLVTLRGSDGTEETIEVGPEVRNLAQVKRGDEVTVTYFESVVFQLLKPGEGQPGVGVAEVADRAQPGERPAAVGAEAIRITATVVKVDKKKPSLTLKGSDGKLVTLPVRDASRLDPVKVGDLLQIDFKRALAVAVEKPVR